MILMLRMSNYIAKFLGAVPCRKSALTGLDIVDPAREVFVWTIEGDRLVWLRLV